VVKGAIKLTRYFLDDQLILEEPWGYRRLFAAGQEIVIELMAYIVTSATVEDGVQVVRLRRGKIVSQPPQQTT
jgi:hypothetical protein